MIMRKFVTLTIKFRFQVSEGISQSPHSLCQFRQILNKIAQWQYFSKIKQQRHKKIPIIYQSK